ncbi:MAG: carboxypeptidase-like regulatory domain-containing protein [Planctomycetota bacterium]
MKAHLGCRSCFAVFVSMAVLALAAGTVNSATIEVTYQVSAGADDGYAWSATEQDIGSGFLMIGDDRTYTTPYYLSAMRFTNIAIPRSATIISANIKISSINTDYRGQVCGVIAAEASDNPADFNGRLVGGAALTTATVAWDFKDAWSPDTQYISPDISNIVQEVVNRPGFGSGNSIAIYYSTRDLSGKARSFASYEYSPASAAGLEITYEYYTISGTVKTNRGVPLEGVQIDAGSDIESTVTDASGYYELYVPVGWSGQVKATNSTAWGFNIKTQLYTNVTTNQVNQNFTIFYPSISGTVMKEDGTPLAGATVTIDSVGSSYITDANGYYEIAVPYHWYGTVSANLVGYYFINKSYTHVTTDQTNQNFTAFQPKISGYVTDSNGIGVENVTVSADNSGGSDTTDATGFYEITVPYDWSGTISVSKTGWGFTEWSHGYTDVTSDLVNQDFTAFQPVISGYVKDSGGTGVEGVLVSADNNGGSDTTGPNGYYEVTVPYDWSGTVVPGKTGWNITPLSRSPAKPAGI